MKGISMTMMRQVVMASAASTAVRRRRAATAKRHTNYSGTRHYRSSTKQTPETVNRNAVKVKKKGRSMLAVLKGLRSAGLLKTAKGKTNGPRS